MVFLFNNTYAKHNFIVIGYRFGYSNVHYVHVSCLYQQKLTVNLFPQVTIFRSSNKTDKRESRQEA